ncbi:MAG: hypothetical protein R3B13_09630 [Polyangiaceae bacterium]
MRRASPTGRFVRLLLLAIAMAALLWGLKARYRRMVDKTIAAARASASATQAAGSGAAEAPSPSTSTQLAPPR